MAITAFLIVASINAVNFVDGLDGLAAGIVAIGGIAFAAYSYIIARSSPSYASLATLIDVVMVGICVASCCIIGIPPNCSWVIPVRCCLAISSPALRL